MNAWMILADSATSHQDGTISMLRAGLGKVWWESEPIPLKAHLIVRVEAEASERGNHEFRLECVDEDGKARLPEFSGTFQTPPIGGNANFIIGLPPLLPKFGLYCFTMVIDRREHARLRLNAVKVDPTHDSEETAI